MPMRTEYEWKAQFKTSSGSTRSKTISDMGSETHTAEYAESFVPEFAAVYGISSDTTAISAVNTYQVHKWRN